MAGDQIRTGDIDGVGVAIGAGASVVIHGDVHYYPIRLRAPLRRVFDQVIKEHTQFFGGRRSLLARLAEFLREPDGGYLVVTAPWGFGKTALMAALVSGTPKAFAYHFFAPTYSSGSLSEGFFLRNVVEQLAEWHGHNELLPDEQHVNQLRALYQRFIDAPLERPRTLVIDGLDEVTGWNLRPYLGQRLSRGLHVILAVRDVGQDWVTEYGLPRDQTTHLPLNGLDRSDVIQVLHAAGGPAASIPTDAALLERVMKVATYEVAPALGADPLYVRLLAGDIAAQELKLSDIGVQPPSLTQYLQQWWHKHARVIDRAALADLLSILTVTLGPISSSDLESLNPRLRHRNRLHYIDDLLRPVRRWVIAAAEGYSLAHPRLRHILQNELRLEPYSEKLLSYCAKWPVNYSPYAFRHYAEHLSLAGRSEVLYALIDQPWMRHKFELSHSQHAFAEDVILTARVAAAAHPPNLAQLLRTCLIYATLGSAVTQVPGRVLDVLVRLDQHTNARELVSMLNDKREQCMAYVGLAKALLDVKNQPEARDVLHQALAAAKQIHDSTDESGTLFSILEELIQAEDFNESLSILELIKDKDYKYWASKKIVKFAYQKYEWNDYVKMFKDGAGSDTKPLLFRALGAELARSQRPEYALSMTRKVNEEDLHDWLGYGVLEGLLELMDPDRALALVDEIHSRLLRTFALCEIAQALVRLGNTKRACDTAYRALELGTTVGGEHDRTLVLCRLVPVFTAAEQNSQARDCALRARTLAMGTPDVIATEVLAEVSLALARVGATEMSLDVVGQIPDESDRNSARRKVALLLAESGVLTEALQLADECAAGHARTRVHLDLAHTLARSRRTKESLIVARAIRNEDERDEALRFVATALLEAGDRDDAMAVIAMIENRSARDTALNWAARVFAESSHIDEALHLLDLIEGANSKIPPLCEIVELLLSVGESARAVEVMSSTLEVAATARKDDRSYWTWIHTSTVEALTRAGEVELALSVAEFDSSLHWRVSMFGTIAQTLAQQGDQDRAADALGRAVEAAEAVNVDRDWSWTSALGFLAGVSLVLGDRPRAQNLVKQVITHVVLESDPTDHYDATYKAGALRAIAAALLESGERERAGEVGYQAAQVALLTRSQSDDEWRLREIAPVLAGAGRIDYALTLVDMIKSSDNSVTALCGIAQALARSGDQRRAVELSYRALALVREKLREPRYGLALHSVVEALTLGDDVDGAIRVTEMGEDENARNYLRRAVSVQLCAMGRLDEALAVSRASEECGHRDWGLSEIAKKLGEAGRATEARGIIGTIASNTAREAALVNVACALAKLRKYHSAREMVLEVLGNLGTHSEIANVDKAVHTLILLGDRNKAEEMANQVLANVRREEMGRFRIIYYSNAVHSLIIKNELNRAQEEILASTENGVPRSWQRLLESLHHTGYSDMAMGFWKAIMLSVRELGRYEVFQAVEAGAPLIGSLGQGEALWNMYRYTMEVDSWWRIAAAVSED